MNRSEIMAAVKSKNTQPELIVRRLLFSLGYRYRIHNSKLPGNPDIIFPSRRKIILVHGCFWHGHDCTAGQNRSISNVEYWTGKLTRNVERDQKNLELLKNAGWSVLVIWECTLKNLDRLRNRLKAFLG